MKAIEWSIITLFILGGVIIAGLKYYTSSDIPSMLSSGVALLFMCFMVVALLQVFIIWNLADQVKRLKKFIDDVVLDVKEIKQETKEIKENTNLLI